MPDQATAKSSTEPVSVTRKRVVGAVTAFALIFTLITLALTCVLPMQSATYLKHLALIATVVFCTGANVYSERFFDGWRDKGIWVLLVCAFTTVYMIAQASVNVDLAPPQSYNSSYLLVTVLMMIVIANIASIIVRKIVWNEFRLWGADLPK
jgi:cation transport ATPase